MSSFVPDGTKTKAVIRSEQIFNDTLRYFTDWIYLHILLAVIAKTIIIEGDIFTGRL